MCEGCEAASISADVDATQTGECAARPPRHAAFAHFHSLVHAGGRLFAWWFAWTGLFALGMACPCCGSPACATGVGVASVFGLLLTVITDLWRRLLRREQKSHDQGPSS